MNLILTIIHFQSKLILGVILARKLVLKILP